MKRTLQIALAATAFATLPQLASAGPIEWAMRGDVDHSRYGTEFYLGAHMRPINNGASHEIVQAYGPMPEGLLPVGAGSASNIELAVLSKQAYRFETSTPTVVPGNTVTFNVRVTDRASGETGHLDFELAAYLLTGMPVTDSSEMVLGGEGGGTLLLGGNRYEVALKTGDTDSGAWVYADLTVTAATPEPGTLTLAALGVCGLGMARRLRRL